MCAERTTDQCSYPNRCVDVLVLGFSWLCVCAERFDEHGFFQTGVLTFSLETSLGFVFAERCDDHCFSSTPTVLPPNLVMCVLSALISTSCSSAPTNQVCAHFGSIPLLVICVLSAVMTTASFLLPKQKFIRIPHWHWFVIYLFNLSNFIYFSMCEGESCLKTCWKDTEKSHESHNNMAW